VAHGHLLRAQLNVVFLSKTITKTKLRASISLDEIRNSAEKIEEISADFPQCFQSVHDLQFFVCEGWIESSKASMLS
jgi:hypothetical protein